VDALDLILKVVFCAYLTLAMFLLGRHDDGGNDDAAAAADEDVVEDYDDEYTWTLRY
jgi:hypothetical protein